MKPVILYCITNLDLGGAQQHLVQLVAAFASRFETVVAYGSPGPALARLEALGARTVRIAEMARRISLLDDLRALIGIRRLIVQLRPAIVHLHSAKAGALGRIAAVGLGVPVVYTVHGWGFKKGVPAARRAIAWLAENALARAAREIVCVCESEARLARRALFVKPRALRVIRNGLPDPPCVAASATRPGPVRAAMVARFQEPKRHDLAVRAMARISAPVELLLVGEGPNRVAVEALAGELGLDGKVRFLGERDDVSTLLGGCDFFLLVSDHEAMPISVLEALRAGIPVAASSVGGIPELIDDGVNGILIRDPSIESIARAISRLACDPTERARLGRQARQRFLERHTEDSMLREIDGVYRGLLAPA